MYHSFFIHSSVYGHLGFFHVLAIVNNAAMNNGIHVSSSILISSRNMPRSGIGEGKTWLKTQHSTVAGHLGFFHVLAIVNSLEMNNGIHVSFSILVSSGYMPSSDIAR